MALFTQFKIYSVCVATSLTCFVVARQPNCHADHVAKAAPDTLLRYPVQVSSRVSPISQLSVFSQRLLQNTCFVHNQRHRRHSLAVDAQFLEQFWADPSRILDHVQYPRSLCAGKAPPQHRQGKLPAQPPPIRESEAADTLNQMIFDSATFKMLNRVPF